MTTFEQRLKDTLARTYVIERELSGGGITRAFVAIDRSLRRKVVIKFLSSELIADVDRDRFSHEIQIAAQLQHPHIVPVLSAGEHEDLLWYTMPFIAGQSLSSAVWKHGPMSVTSVVQILFHVSEALDYAHGEGVVHRDIKAANILRSGTHSLVTDFGVAKALNASMAAPGIARIEMAIGRRAYMAPEQLSGDPAADHRIDIYAVGLLAYGLLKGRSPFAAAPFAKAFLADPSRELPPLIDVRPDVPRSLSELVMRCLSKEPDDRPATARALLNALDAFSTASGEIRTTEHPIHPVEPTVPPAVPAATGPVAVSGTTDPIAVSATPAQEQTVSVNEPTEADKIEVEPARYDRPKKDRKKMVAAGVAILVPVAAGAFFLSQRTGDQPSKFVAPPSNAAESALSMQPPPAAVPKSRARVAKRAKATIDSQAIKDSLTQVAAKLAAARNDALRKADSVRVETNKANARRAAGALLSNASAHKAFTDGATHKGGILGSKRKGDLQMQIDALLPFLNQAGLTYEQFKGIVADSGVWMFDEFGRMVPEALRQFAGSGG